jgi:hypothetical protein
MKITEHMRNVPIKAEPKVLKFKGNVRLELRDIKTGEVEVVADHNLQTNAIDQMLANCGFLNSTNLDKSNLAKQLIGGVCLFDTAITENPAITVPPAGLTMTANGAVDTINNDVPTELGSYSSTESGWRDANSYVEVYDWTSSQGNGVIACVCATNNEMGYSGFGNADGNATTRNFTLIGSNTTYYVTGYAIRVSLSDSDCYTITFDGNNKATIRHYLLPITIMSMAGTVNSPKLLDSREITIPAELDSIVSGNGLTNLLYYKLAQSVDGIMKVFNMPSDSGTWGTDFTQKLWEIEPVAGTVTETTLANTSGDTLHGIDLPVWIDKDCVAFINGGAGGYYHPADARYVYSMKRTNNVWSTIQKCANPNGSSSQYGASAGWNGAYYAGNGRAFVVSGSVTTSFDYSANKCYKINGHYQYNDTCNVVDAPLVRFNCHNSIDTTYAIDLLRVQTCIASIYNLQAPITKTAEKTMKLLYTFTFGEEE